MKLANFYDGASARIGVVEGDEIVDVKSGDERLPNDILSLLLQGEAGLEAVRRAAKHANRIALSQVKLGPPIPARRKFMGLGLSYRTHVEEMRKKGMVSDHQMWFNKQVTCINGPYDPIHLPKVSQQLDYEGELAFVIGNDVSVRDWQRRAPGGILGKSFDTHGPTGPWLTTADEVPHPENLGIKTWVDGELRQN